MATKNDITGDSIQTRGVSDAYRDNYDLIWGKKDKKKKESDNDEVCVQVQTERDDVRNDK